MVEPILKNVDDTIAGIMRRKQNGLNIPPVKYSKILNWIRSYIKKIKEYKSFNWFILIPNWRYKLVVKPKIIIAKLISIGKGKLR